MSNSYPAPYRTAPKDALVDPTTCYNRECTSYCAWKIAEVRGGVWLKRNGDLNAKNWIYALPKWGYQKVAAPKAGGKYVGVRTAGTYGHVLWFEGINKNGTITVSEYNYNFVGGYGTRSVNKADYIWYQIKAPPAPKPTPVPAKGDYKVVKTIRGYVNSADAKARKNSNSTVPAGTYYTFSQANGMRNITRKKGTPGWWINPGDNKVSTAKPKKFHTVQKNQFLSTIAAKYKISMNTLLAFPENGKYRRNPNEVYPGDKVRVQ